MTQVWRNEEHSMPTLVTALDKLKALRKQADADVFGTMSLEEIDTIIDHCESTKGQFLMPDVPM